MQDGQLTLPSSSRLTPEVLDFLRGIPFSLIRYSHLQDFTHRYLKEYCKYISDAASDPCKPRINGRAGTELWHCAGPSLCQALHVPAGALACPWHMQGSITLSPLLRKTSLSSKDRSHGSTGTHTLLCYQHMPVLRNVTRALKHQALAPPWIWASPMGESCSENFRNTFVKAKKNTADF